MDSADPAGRPRALQEISALARQHGLTLTDIAAALGQAPEPAQENRLRGILVRVLGFLGGTFVFAGIGVFIALQWDDMPRGEKPRRFGSGSRNGGSYTSASAVSGGFGPGSRRMTAPGNPRTEPQIDPSAAGETA